MATTMSFSIPSRDHNRISIASTHSEEESTYSSLFSIGKLKASKVGLVEKHNTFSNHVLSNLSQFAKKYLDLGIETFSEDSESSGFSDDSVPSFEIRFANEDQSVDESRVSSLSQTRTTISGANSTIATQTRTSLSGASYIPESAENSTAMSKEDIVPILSSILGAPSATLVRLRAGGADDKFSKASTPVSFRPVPPGANHARCSTAGSSVGTSFPPTDPTTSALEPERGHDCTKRRKEENTTIFVEANMQMNCSSPGEKSAKTPVENVYLPMHCPDNEQKAEGLGIIKEKTYQPQHRKILGSLKMPGQAARWKPSSPRLSVDTNAAKFEASSVLNNEVNRTSKRPLSSAGSSSQNLHMKELTINEPASKTDIARRLDPLRRKLRSLIPHPVLKEKEAVGRTSKKTVDCVSPPANKCISDVSGSDVTEIRVLDTTDTTEAEGVEVARERTHRWKPGSLVPHPTMQGIEEATSKSPSEESRRRGQEGDFPAHSSPRARTARAAKTIFDRLSPSSGKRTSNAFDPDNIRVLDTTEMAKCEGIEVARESSHGWKGGGKADPEQAAEACDHGLLRSMVPHQVIQGKIKSPSETSRTREPDADFPTISSPRTRTAKAVKKILDRLSPSSDKGSPEAFTFDNVRVLDTTETADCEGVEVDAKKPGRWKLGNLVPRPTIKGVAGVACKSPSETSRRRVPDSDFPTLSSPRAGTAKAAKKIFDRLSPSSDKGSPEAFTFDNVRVLDTTETADCEGVEVDEKKPGRWKLGNLVPRPTIKGIAGVACKSSSETSRRRVPNSDFPTLSSPRAGTAKAAKKIFDRLSPSSDKGSPEAFSFDNVRVLDTTETADCEGVEVAKKKPSRWKLGNLIARPTTKVIEGAASKSPRETSRRREPDSDFSTPSSPRARTGRAAKIIFDRLSPSSDKCTSEAFDLDNVRVLDTTETAECEGVEVAKGSTHRWRLGLVPHRTVQGLEGATSKSPSETSKRQKPDADFPILSSPRARTARAAKKILQRLSPLSHKCTSDAFDSYYVRVLDTTETAKCERVEMPREKLGYMVPHQVMQGSEGAASKSPSETSRRLEPNAEFPALSSPRARRPGAARKVFNCLSPSSDKCTPEAFGFDNIRVLDTTETAECEGVEVARESPCRWKLRSFIPHQVIQGIKGIASKSPSATSRRRGPDAGFPTLSSPRDRTARAAKKIFNRLSPSSEKESPAAFGFDNILVLDTAAMAESEGVEVARGSATDGSFGSWFRQRENREQPASRRVKQTEV